MIRFNLGTELGIANYIQRHFDWCSSLLFVREIPGFEDPNRLMIILSGKDVIVNASRVRRYLKSEGMRDAILKHDPVSLSFFLFSLCHFFY